MRITTPSRYYYIFIYTIALGIFSINTGFSASRYSHNQCNKPAHAIRVSLQRVYDGDTVKLNSGQTVRLVGINTVEIFYVNQRRRRRQPARHMQPLALLARKTLGQLLKQSNNQIYLVYEKKRYDRYGRLLAHLFAGDTNVQAFLLAKGLAYNLPFPPNLAYQKCYFHAQKNAMKNKINLWSQPFYAPRSAKFFAGNSRSGFVLIQGKVTNAYQDTKSIWLNFKHRKISVRIANADLHYFRKKNPLSLLGKNILISGYVTKNRQKQFYYIRVRHPNSLHIFH